MPYDTHSRPQIMKVEELASLLAITPKRARQKCAAGEIPGAVRFGHRWLIDRATFLQALAERSHG